MKPIYTLFAGVNGAGKTTLFNMQDKDLGVRVNSDEIVVAKFIKGKKEECDLDCTWLGQIL